MNTGKIYTIGPYPHRTWARATLYALDQRDTSACLPHFDVDGFRAIAFEDKESSSNRSPAVELPKPHTDYPRACTTEQYFWSWAMLDNTVQVATCRASMDDKHVVGLLFTYVSGSQASVGRVRLDYLEEPLQIDQLTGFWLCFRDREPQICGLSLIQPTQPGLKYLHIECRGRLEWWHSYRQCRVHYQQHASEPPRL